MKSFSDSILLFFLTRIINVFLVKIMLSKYLLLTRQNKTFGSFYPNLNCRPKHKFFYCLMRMIPLNVWLSPETLFVSMSVNINARRCCCPLLLNTRVVPMVLPTSGGRSLRIPK